MSDFDFNNSHVGEGYHLTLHKNLVQAIRAHARTLLLPFFQRIAIETRESEEKKPYPVLTNLAERIIQKIYDTGEFNYNNTEARSIALEFIRKQNEWRKYCLSFYVCTNSEFLEQLKVEVESDITLNDEYKNLSLEESYRKNGQRIQVAVNELVNNEQELATYLVRELIHLQDIFSVEDISYWTVSSITNATENFEQYAGKGLKLIPVPIDEYDYWERVMGDNEEEGEDDDDWEEE